MENLSKLKNEDFDLAVLIGPQRPGLPSIVLPDVQVQVVGAHCGQENDPLTLLLYVSGYSAEDCPYSHSFPAWR